MEIPCAVPEADDNFNNPNVRNNANFATPGDGSSPRMQMYLFTNPFRDGDMDTDVIFHEYGHGPSNRLVGGGNLGGGAQTGALGEGWSDVIATTINNDPVLGEYVTGNATRGIRRVAYNNSPLTYANLCSGACEVHNDGEIWASTLWESAHATHCSRRIRDGEGYVRAARGRRNEEHHHLAHLP